MLIIRILPVVGAAGQSVDVRAGTGTDSAAVRQSVGLSVPRDRCTEVHERNSRLLAGQGRLSGHRAVHLPVAGRHCVCPADGLHATEAMHDADEFAKIVLRIL